MYINFRNYFPIYIRLQQDYICKLTDTFINIKYMVPSLQSTLVLIRQKSTFFQLRKMIALFLNIDVSDRNDA